MTPDQEYPPNGSHAEDASQLADERQLAPGLSLSDGEAASQTRMVDSSSTSVDATRTHELAPIEASWTPQLPEGHRIPPDATFHLGEDDGRCRVIRPDGRRCGAPRVRALGLCSGHAGIGGVATDPTGSALLAHASKARIRERRQLLGIGPRRNADPRQIARIRAHERAEDAALALVDAPLDDRSLGTIERQRAVVTMLDAVFPLATTSVEIELPVEGAGVAQLGWQDMQALAARLLDS